MAPYKRILVHLQHSPGAAPVLANFTECILDSFNFKNNSGNVSVELKDDNLILSPATTSPVVLTHPSFCPIHCLTPTAAESLAIETRQRGVDVGVVIVLETSDTKVLVTRRAKHMRTFPGTWVPPGGHVESGEKLLEAGLRELGEETGLVLPPDSVQGSRVLALWESVYPYSLGMGPPKRHHIVLYYWVRTCETSCELQTRLQLDASEVDAAMWLTPSLAKLVASGELPPGCPNSVALTLLDNEGKMTSSTLSTSFLVAEAPESGPDIERISTGTRYALQQWILAREQEESLFDLLKTTTT